MSGHETDDAGDAALVRGATGESLSLVFQAYSAIIAAAIIALVASWRLAHPSP